MKVITISTNNAIFIELQYNTLKKFLQTDFEFIVFNDGKDWDDITNFYNKEFGKDAILKKCVELNIKCINIPNNHHIDNGNATLRHTDSLKFCLEYMKSNIDEYLMIDSDMFLIDYLNIEIYRKFTNACVPQSVRGIKYIWPNFFYIDFRNATNINLIDFNIKETYDTGSCMDKWTENCEQSNKIFFILHLCSLSWDETNLPTNIDKSILEVLKNDPRNQNDKFFYELYDGKFLHYRAGTNWMNQSKDLHDENIVRLEKFIQSIL